MTNNADFNTALTWCVTHFQDGDFNEPLIFLKSDKPSSSDRQLMDMVEKAISESRRGPLPDIHGSSTEVQPQQSGACASFEKKPPLSSTDNNESGFSFDWDDDDDLGDMLGDVDDEAPVAADSAGSVSSNKALPVGDGIAKASAPQPQNAAKAKKLGADGWGGFDDFDDILNDDDKGTETTPRETNETGTQLESSKNVPVSHMPVPAKPDDSPITRNLPLESSPTAAASNGGGWDEDDNFDNFDDMLDEKYGEEDAATQQDITEPASIATPAAIELGSMQLLKSVPPTAEPEIEAEKSVSMAKDTVAPRPSQPPPASESITVDSVVRPSQPSPSQISASRSNLAPSPAAPPPRPPPAQPKVAAIPTQSPIRSVREQSQLLSQEERKRMVEEGRRLLREKRLAQQSKASSPTVQGSSASSVSRPATQSTTFSRATCTDVGATASSSAASASASTSNKPTAVTYRAGTATKVTDPSERERLIMEGRRLLMEARKAKKNGEAVSVGATPKPNLKPRPPPTPPPRRSPPSPSASSPPPPASNALDKAGKTEKAKDDDDDDNWDDFDKF